MTDFTQVQLYKIAPKIETLQQTNNKLKKSNKFLWFSLFIIAISSITAIKLQQFNFKKIIQKIIKYFKKQ